ncbi:MAG TPA: fasciclin domain-containing protein [Gaiellaceae bacterium]|nr:fasciclin domain-containing protein [Gaiellaceae bacterium]
MKTRGTVFVIGAAALVAATSISAATPAKATAMGQKNIVQTAVAAGKFKTLVSLVKKAGLAGTLSAPGSLTVFAPTDQAFANLKKRDPALYNKVATDKKLLQSVLTYHVVGKRIPAAAALAAAKKAQKVKTVQGESIGLSFKSGKILLNGSSRVVIADVKASNGVVHAINAVIVPPSLSKPAAPAPTQSIVQIAAGNPEFSTLVSLVQKAGLVEAISAKGPFTVFAPTNEAFAKLAKEAPATYAAVLADPSLLAKVLTYHVVAGDVRSASAIAVARQNGTVKALAGESISLSLKDGKLILNSSSTVVKADVLGTNGVIHAIDTVIVPPSLSA